MANVIAEEVFDVPFTFTPRARPISCELRPVWRIHALLLILDQCWGSQASMEQLHVLNWATRNRESRSAFLDFLKGKRTPSQTIVRHDPSLNRAVHFAFAEGLVERRESSGESSSASPPYRVILSKKGRDLLKELHSMEDCYSCLKRFLSSLPHKVTRQEIESLFSWGDR